MKNGCCFVGKRDISECDVALKGADVDWVFWVLDIYGFVEECFDAFKACEPLVDFVMEAPKFFSKCCST